MIPRLAEDHANARILAEGLASFPQLAIDLATVQTNIVKFGLRDSRWASDGLVRALGERGLRVGDIGSGNIRAVLHYGIEAGDVEEALEIVGATLAGG